VAVGEDEHVIELRLRTGPVVAFDGRVLEVFDGGTSRRAHVSLIGPTELSLAPGGGLVLALPSLELELSFDPAEARSGERLATALADARAADLRP
jgi:hypothetical protein